MMWPCASYTNPRPAAHVECVFGDADVDIDHRRADALVEVDEQQFGGVEFGEHRIGERGRRGDDLRHRAQRVI
ncbi:MAG: hypothetical protein M5R40_29175 [Anaerolineae bacterium]|nr:hypothetical protein [Anaerolineae bacterium]